MKKYVITGGPGDGKTSTIEDLKKKGFYVVSETAREVIQEQLDTNGKIVPWIDLDAFNRVVLKIQTEKEKNIPEKESIVFLDRGLGDGVGYYYAENRKAIPELLDALKKIKYDKIFLLEQLPVHVKDSVRREDAKKAGEINEGIYQAYKDLGFDVIRIPVASIKERTKIILKKIKDK